MPGERNDRLLNTGLTISMAGAVTRRATVSMRLLMPRMCADIS
jgi:hypothetical protein